MAQVEKETPMEQCSTPSTNMKVGKKIHKRTMVSTAGKVVSRKLGKK